ncbi:MAG: hypothetical protein PHE53_01840 [Thermoguttaceae bacterium]|nr:hypothetical protein [Thermoguttaceae bacterium]
MNPEMNRASENDPPKEVEPVRGDIGEDTQNKNGLVLDHVVRTEPTSPPPESVSAQPESTLSPSELLPQPPESVTTETKNVSKKSDRDTPTERSREKERFKGSNSPKKPRLSGVSGVIIFLLLGVGLWWGWNTWQKAEQVTLSYPQFRTFLKNGMVCIPPQNQDEKTKKTNAAHDVWLAIPKNIRVTPDEITGQTLRSERPFATQEKAPSMLDREKIDETTAEKVECRVSRYGLTEDP